MFEYLFKFELTKLSSLLSFFFGLSFFKANVSNSISYRIFYIVLRITAIIGLSYGFFFKRDVNKFFMDSLID